MAVSAYVFINADTERVTEVLEKVKKFPDVEEARHVTGTYDIIAFIRPKDLYTLGEMVAEKIQGIDGVSSTVTSIVLI